MNSPPQSRAGYFRMAAAAGAATCLAFGIIESIGSWALAWALRPAFLYVPPHAGFVALMFAVYVAGGGALGVTLALILRSARRPERRDSAVTTVALVITLVCALAVGINILVQPRMGMRFLATLLPPAVLLIVLLGRVVRTHPDSYHLRSLTSAWTIAIATLGIPWLQRDVLGASARLAQMMAFAWPISVLALAGIVAGLRRRFVANNRQARWGRRLAARISVAGLLIAFAAGVRQQPRHSEPEHFPVRADVTHPNILLIVMDTVRADHMSVYGYDRPTTPIMSELCREATRFANAISPADTTLASHASLFTGVYPTQHGAHYVLSAGNAAQPLSESFTTMAEYLGRVGYSTAGIVSNYGFLGHGYFRVDRGFEYYDQREPVNWLSGARVFVDSRIWFPRERIREWCSAIVDPRHSDITYRTADDITASVLERLDEWKRSGNRSFLFVNYMDAHWPYMPPPPFARMFPGKVDGYRSSQYYELERGVLCDRRTVTQAEHDHLVSQYDGGLAFLDQQLGRVWTHLKRLGLFDNCLIIVTSDHGESFGERQIVGHGVCVYQEAVHIPLIVKFPGRPAAQVSEQTVTLLDVLPTVLASVGIDVPRDLPGRDLRHASEFAPRRVLSESFPNNLLVKHHARFNRIARAVFAESQKLISCTNGKRELYDLTKDPAEQHDLYPGHGGANESQQWLDRWLASVKAHDTVGARGMDSAMRDRLEKLGYLNP